MSSTLSLAAPVLTDPALVSLQELMTAYARATPVRKVAAVGNAPLEPSDARAAEIDSCDLVIRVNSFVMDRPEQPRCQGSRVDIVVWNRITRATPFLYENYRDRLYLLVEPMRMHGNKEMWPPSWPEDLGLVPVPNNSVARRLNEELGIPWQEERLAPTTGLTAAYLAVTLFPEADVVLTGFSFVDDPSQTEWRHQWGDSCPVGPEHRIAEESRLMRSWIDDGRARFLR
ncbi:MAG TPA: hypothetical protein VK204_08985 [Nocardioidaceae bacterium]|nr:hypothetical protein [Nocardioidaceae bacterium]